MSRRLCLALLLLPCIGATTASRAFQAEQRESATPQGPKRATASVHGRVTDAATGKPVRLARVRITLPSGASGAPRTTTTDEAGRYAIRNLPAGPYFVAVTKARYLPIQHGQQDTGGAGKPIDVAEGRATEINFALRRAGVITGRVFDEFGDPIERASVHALRVGYPGGKRSFIPAALATSNDAGGYRLSGLAAGDYYIMASERDEGFGREAEADIGFYKTLYPGTTDPAQGRAISVGAAQETPGIDIMLIPAPTARLSGLVTTAGGQPGSGVQLTLQAVDQALGGMGGQARTQSDGTFVYPRLLPGRYELHARRPRAPGEAFEAAIVPVTIAGDEVFVPVPLTRGGRVTGRVIVPDGATLRPQDVRLIAQPIGDTFAFGVGGTDPVKEDWTFEWTYLVAPRIIRANLPPGWHLVSVKRGEENITDTPTVFTDPDRIEIVLDNTSANLAGSVMGRDGKPTSEYTVIVFPEETAQWTQWSRFIRTARPDQNGAFKIEGLAPERYLAAAVERVEAERWLNAEYLETLRPLATPVTIQSRTENAVVLRMVTP